MEGLQEIKGDFRGKGWQTSLLLIPWAVRGLAHAHIHVFWGTARLLHVLIRKDAPFEKPQVVVCPRYAYMWAQCMHAGAPSLGVPDAHKKRALRMCTLGSQGQVRVPRVLSFKSFIALKGAPSASMSLKPHPLCMCTMHAADTHQTSETYA